MAIPAGMAWHFLAECLHFRLRVFPGPDLTTENLNQRISWIIDEQIFDQLQRSQVIFFAGAAWPAVEPLFLMLRRPSVHPQSSLFSPVFFSKS